MKRLLILGAGTGGTIMANKMRKELSREEWKITLVDKEKTHYYQPGFLFIPFGYYKKEDVIKPKQNFMPAGVEIIYHNIEKIEAGENKILLENGEVITYDILIIATGTRINPEETPGLQGELWHKKIFDFYTVEGALALSNFFKSWEGGELVINVADNPIKCPVAPLEFAFFADAFFTERGMRDKVSITFVTPLSGAFTKPRASKLLGGLLEEKNINLVTDYFLGEVDNDKQVITDFGGREIKFDCLVSIPLHSGAEVIEKSGLGDDFGFVPADKHTLQSKAHENIFVIGDAGNFPTSKAGSVVHFMADILHENLMCYIEGRQFTGKYDGHSNCFIETGHGKGALIDFNYDTEPLPGFYPLPGIGPLGLLKQSRLNHYGKLFFRWIYWHILLRGKEMPIDTEMTMAGKKLD
ncbi:MAG: NAD(P)/FAD-dependent oxidoreductase [Bacteroidales bacterium]|nr:NAD(P)/FAD-dependent oxidoreductase [Bacteroidales bacterium]